MKNILVPIDFSPYSLSAAKAAVAIARKTGGNIHLLHLAKIPVGWHKLAVSTQQKYPALEVALVDARIKLEKFSKQAIFKDRNLFTHVHGGVPFEQIVLFAKKNKIDLIVMGVHGAGDTELKYIGSTAQKVIRMAHCPVLGVKKNFTFGPIKKILFASNFDENVNPIINTIKNLATDVGANIDLAYVNTPHHFVDDNTMEARMKQFTIVQKQVKFHHVIQNSAEKDEGILTCAKKRNAQIISMATHLRKQKAGYLVGITDSILFRSKLPVLSFVIDESRYQIK
jgi:nucleotide-binding universal stress UspA family protein